MDDPVNNIQMYTGVGVGFVLVHITLAIIRWRKETTNTNMEEIRPDNIENAKNVAKVEYAVLIKTSVTRRADKFEMDSDAIYENECKPRFVLSTENVDQMYDHVPTDEKLPNLMDETYNHATLVQKLDNEEYQNVSSVLPNPTKVDTEDGMIIP
ncbi:hypothetical protein CHS0354_034079 [Potamilus streckersoni]|uniref:Uncharacterized protein n=1 Tax=Potamilus streckersoni TaxID=2493646 RepID=A0AAE0RUX6_9BIVA|nr:hypothetical protein CHS0354_034079 [Potamilus streckersoni]